jgi:hypothetical protein
MISNQVYAQQKAALTRAIKTKDREKVLAACKAAVAAWGNEWPDDWARWQRALDDLYPVFEAPQLEDLTSNTSTKGT